MHLASASGHIEIVKFLYKIGMDINPKDRWGATPLNDAHSKEMYDFLVSNEGIKGADQV